MSTKGRRCRFCRAPAAHDALDHVMATLRTYIEALDAKRTASRPDVTRDAVVMVAEEQLRDLLTDYAPVDPFTSKCPMNDSANAGSRGRKKRP